MKTQQTPAPGPEFGRRYWRSPDQWSGSAESGQWLEREFPESVLEEPDALSRREFVRLMSASLLLAGVGLGSTGCRRPEERLMPFAQQPEGYVHGRPEFYASAMPTRTGAIPLVVKVHEGRPIKIEGNDRYPDGNGGTDRWAQASILSLYDPDRARRVTRDGQTVPRQMGLDFLTELSGQLAAQRGRGLAILAEPGTSPSRARLRRELMERLPEAAWYEHDPLDLAVHRRAASRAYGRPVQPRFRFDRARVVVSLDCDFLGTEDDAFQHIRRFAQSRRLEQPSDEISRLYVLEALLTLTGAQADHRLRLPASQVAAAAVYLARRCGVGGLPEVSTEGLWTEWLDECARDLVAHRGQVLVLAGHRQPLAVHLLAHAINHVLGSVGQTVELVPAEEAAGTDGLAELAAALRAGRVDTLVILGANPVYTAPADLNWAEAQQKARTVVRLGYYEDETFPHCHWHFPLAHFLESWGDVLTSDGAYLPVQPMIQPLFGGLTELEFLARLAGRTVWQPYEIVRETFRQREKPANFEEEWKFFLHDGFRNGPAAGLGRLPLQESEVREAVKALSISRPGPDRLEVIWHRDHSVDDGRYANNGWLQELPDPITKITWENVVLMSRRTAEALGVANSELVEVRIGDRMVTGPAWVQPGMADHVVALALGYGRERAGRVGRRVGFNAYTVRTSAAPHVAVGATVRGTGRRHVIACTQDHWSMEGRAIIREANLEQFRKHPDFVKRLNLHEPPVVAPLYPNPLDREKQKALHQWGMSIDLNACVGCSACVIACQSENNIPIVGKDQVRRGREMHWMRIDRYYASDPARQGDKRVWNREEKQWRESWIEDVQVVMQPMLCQHCEAAPCENVCPVNATVHDHEGLNVMVYNRCVGTRYCSNNCPYKVRRFNFFDYNKRPLDGLYKGPFARRPQEELELVKMVKNPDVTVRMRGVMEKCTFCIQRIEQAKIQRKVQARDSGDVVVPDGTFTTACAQACPAGAIVFGNIADPDSRVSRLKRQSRDYSVLEFLLTKPRTTYLARIRNPNPAMPDYREIPFTLAEYTVRSGDPFGEGHGAGGGQEPGHGAAAPAEH
ncbi:TAT-variant-translocated molybdopterin oxidoreductase [Limisphaera sp. 4302-co]|uniref:TAT-variant-translocated molybdopterin oxidoreductase n=1 Tax=Limisphaera sp. 4302-co TaxID=3400417 RepID=UPI003C169B06